MLNDTSSTHVYSIICNSNLVSTVPIACSTSRAQGTISQKHSGDKMAPWLVYFVLEKELLNFSEKAHKTSTGMVARSNPTQTSMVSTVMKSCYNFFLFFFISFLVVQNQSILHQLQRGTKSLLAPHDGRCHFSNILLLQVQFLSPNDVK